MTNLPTPSDAELRLLDELWKRGRQSVRALSVALHAEPTTVQYRTVQVLLDRLEKKRWVRRDRGQRPHLFEAAVDRGAFLGQQLQHMADKVCDGALAPLLLNLAGQARLSAEERDALWQLLGDDEGDPEAGTPEGERG